MPAILDFKMAAMFKSSAYISYLRACKMCPYIFLALRTIFYQILVVSHLEVGACGGGGRLSKRMSGLKQIRLNGLVPCSLDFKF
jgi:hypothetical protein